MPDPLPRLPPRPALQIVNVADKIYGVSHTNRLSRCACSGGRGQRAPLLPGVGHPCCPIMRPHPTATPTPSCLLPKRVFCISGCPMYPAFSPPPAAPRRIDVIQREDALTFLETEERRAAAAQRAAHAEAAAARRSKGKAPLMAPPEEEGAREEGDAMEED